MAPAAVLGSLSIVRILFRPQVFQRWFQKDTIGWSCHACCLDLKERLLRYQSENGLFLPHTIKREHFFFNVATFPAESWKWWTLATLTKGVIGCWSFSDFLKFKLIFINIVRPKKGSRNLEAKMCAKHCKYKRLCRKLFGGRHLYIVFRHCKRIDHQAPVTHVAFENIWLLQHTWWKSKV